MVNIRFQPEFQTPGQLDEDSKRHRRARSARGADEVQPARHLPRLRDLLRRPVAGAPVQDLPGILTLTSKATYTAPCARSSIDAAALTHQSGLAAH